MTVTETAVLPNLRDLGGLPLPDGLQTRSGVLYRSALPVDGDATPTGVAEWPARTVVDLRSPREQATRAHPFDSADTLVHRIALMSDGEVARPDPNFRLADLYLRVLDRAGTQLAEILDVAATAPGPILLHCAAGKDRTGIAVAMLLRVAGVGAAEVVDDYTATNDHMDAVLARITRFAPELGRVHPTNRDLVGAPPEAIQGVLDTWDAEPGGVRTWLLQRGATEDALERWTARFTEDDDTRR